MKRMLICLFCLIIIFSGCSIFDPVYHADEELLVTSNRDSTLYQYSGVVQLDHSYGTHFTDSLSLSHDIRQSKKEFFDNLHSYEILSGYFSMFCWNDFKIFILMEDTYYVYDIKSYTFPPIDDDGYDNYELLEYTKDEFQKAYPDYSSYDWTICETPPSPELLPRVDIDESLPFNLPSTAKILEYKDTRYDKLAEGYYIKGKVQLYFDEESERFIEKIKSDWVDNISQNESYEEIERVAFSKDVIPFSDDYYYYYKNDYYNKSTTGFYYGDYFNIFAFDDKKMTLYFYISD